ncbi:septum formation protein [Hydrogenivirga caldilitoris]|uniref:dTTP/UTP pyrophosphatase n=1 Tax=Hydrogenivirga caldilitoris TaxID=246264 RepID=A0A497XRH3_9AQUI|nr:Maf family protein [Hydrogenivirga caldilitoris]RLJ70874.1 septum formation protein [Hydrogenivirga caldilitoris]
MGRVVLASASPRRREILSLLGIEFEVVPSGIEEHTHGDPITTARRLSYEKALDVWKSNKDALVIGADTLVFVGKEIIGKPRDEEEAFQTLSFLSGRWHRVVTAVSFVSKGFRKTVHDVARVKFRKLSGEEIRFYISTGEPMDKAGAYGVQGFGATIVERIEGNFYTVMGLPIHKVYEVLRKLTMS